MKHLFTSLSNRPIPSFLLLGIFFGLSACSPQVLQIKPIADEFREEQGRTIVKQWKEGLKIVTAYDGEYNDFVVFDTEILNQTADTIKIDPTAFTLVPFSANKDTLKNERGFSLTYYAADPQVQLKKAELAMKRAKTLHTVSTVLNVLLVAANVYSDVSSSSKNKSFARFEADRFFHQNNYQLLIAKQQIDDISYYNRLDKLHYDRGNWASEPFKKTFLMPNESLRGRIYLPKNSRAELFKVAYPVPSGDELSFWFEQKLVKKSSLPQAQ